MAVNSNKQARRLAVMALAISALTLPGVAQANPENGERGGWRARSEDGGRQPQSDNQDNEGRRARQAPQEEVRAAPPPQAAPPAQGNWSGGDRRDRSDTRDGERRGWNGGAGAPQAAPPPPQQPVQQGGWAGANRDGRGWNDGKRRDGDREAPSQGATWNREGARAGAGRSWTDANRETREGGDRRKHDQHRDRDRSGGYVSGGNYYGDSGCYSHNDHDRDHRRWDRQWRSNTSYNWYSYRSSHPSYFRLGSYYAPYRNYSYRRLSIGFFLENLFFGQTYWIEDPRYYRLPDIYGPYRWVRYYDDAVLVDVYSGEVVDVIYNFFW